MPVGTRDDLRGLTQSHLGRSITRVQAALPAMRQAGFGRIVLMSSRGALGLQTRTAYSATKAGMVGMARTWALELAPQGITVNVVAPGPIQTDMFYDVVDAGSEREHADRQSFVYGKSVSCRLYLGGRAIYKTKQILMTSRI